MQCHSNEEHCQLDTPRLIQLDTALQLTGTGGKLLDFVFYRDELFSMKLCTFNSVLWIGPCWK